MQNASISNASACKTGYYVSNGQNSTAANRQILPSRVKQLRGRMYWTEKGVRVRLENGHLIDLGRKSYEKAQYVAELLGLSFISGWVE